MPVAILALANICDESTRAVKISQGKIPAQFGAPGSLAFAVESRDELIASGCDACEENLEIRRKRSEGFPDPGPGHPGKCREGHDSVVVPDERTNGRS